MNSKCEKKQPMKKMGLAVLIAFILVPVLMSAAHAQTPQERGYLGASVQDLTGDLVKSLNLTTDKGVLVSEVAEGGPADKAGVRKGDVITGFNDKEVQNARELVSIVAATPIDGEVPVRLFREGREITVLVRVGKLDFWRLLNQYVSSLRTNPNDYALREKIIKLAQAMKPAPNIPEEAERFMARGAVAVKTAKTEGDFQDAVDEFEKATLAAPWLPAAYYNLGIAQDKAGKYGEAVRNLRLYLVAAPDATDAKAVKTLIYEIEYRQEKAAKESSPEAVAAKKRNEFEAWLKKLDGAHFVYSETGPWGPAQATIDVQGNRVILGNKLIQCIKDWCPGTPGQWYKDGETTLNGPEFFFPESNCFPVGKTIRKGKISDDGYSIRLTGCQDVSITFHRE